VRVRVGISPATASGKLKKPTGEEKVNKFILGKLKPTDKAVLKKLSKKLNESITLLISETRETAMNVCNQT